MNRLKLTKHILWFGKCQNTTIVVFIVLLFIKSEMATGMLLFFCLDGLIQADFSSEIVKSTFYRMITFKIMLLLLGLIAFVVGIFFI